MLIVSSMYNVEEWVERTIKSVTAQNYKNYKYILVDDISTDKTVELARALTYNFEHITILTNTEKKYSLRNIYEGIQALNPSPEDIIVTLDGDDWLAKPNVFNIICISF